MRVAQLIARLRKMPSNAKVVVCAHDQNPEAGEFDGIPSTVYEAPEALRARGYSVVIGL